MFRSCFQQSYEWTKPCHTKSKQLQQVDPEIQPQRIDHEGLVVDRGVTVRIAHLALRIEQVVGDQADAEVLEEAFVQIGTTFGSYQFKQPTIDVNMPITEDGTVLFRVTADYTSAESYFDVLETD
jgi:hypothetical protein